MGCNSSTVVQDARPSVDKNQVVIFRYWNVRGGHRGNGTRYILNYCGVNYKEETYTLTAGDNDWTKAKNNLGLEFPNLPHIVDGDFNITETIALQQYIAKKWKPELLGKTPQERARVMQLHGITNEKANNMLFTCFRQDDKAVTAKESLDGMEKTYEFLGDKKFLTGEQVTVPDFVIFEQTNFAIELNGADKCWERYPNLKGHNERMKNLPGLK